MAAHEKPTPVLPHGGSGEDFLGAHYPDAPKPWLDLSTGINPWPYPLGGISPDTLTRLPAPSLADKCRAAAATYFNAPKSSVALLPGSQAAISLLPRLFSSASVAILTPGYSEHAAAWSDNHVQLVPAADVASNAADILVLTNPNNPDGHLWRRDDILRLAKARSARNQWLIVDEAFADLAPEHSVADACGDHRLIVLRSFGKFFGLAGVRLGFAIAPPDLATQLEAMMGPWAVSGPALEAGYRAYSDLDWQAATRLRLAEAVRRLRTALDSYGLVNAGGTSLFLLARHPAAASLFDLLCQQGIYVRRFADQQDQLRFGLPADQADHARLEAVLGEWSGHS